MGAHAHGALQDRPLQRAAGALINVVFAEGTLGRGHLGNRFGKRSLPRLTAVEDAGLVEVNMRFDEAGNVAADIEEISAGDGDIDGRRISTADAGIAQDQVESHVPSLRSPIDLAVFKLCDPILTRATGGDEAAQPWRWHDAC